jgi:hypothetical protein
MTGVPTPASIALALLPWAAAAALGAAVYHYAPFVGARSQIAAIEGKRAAWEKKSGEWQRSSAGWEASYRLSETRRGNETATAQAAANSLIQQCSARVAEARASARVIERIVTKEPTYDANRCPVRELVDPDSLREALGPRPGSD